MKRKNDDELHSEDEYTDETWYSDEMELSDCSRCGARPGLTFNPDNQGYTSCNIDEETGLVTECNKCEDRMH